MRPLPYLLNKCLYLFNEIYFVSCDNSVLLNFSYFESFCLNIQTKNPKVAWLLVLAYSFIGHPILLCLTVLFTLRPFTFLPLPFFYLMLKRSLYSAWRRCIRHTGPIKQDLNKIIEKINKTRYSFFPTRKSKWVWYFFLPFLEFFHR